MTSVLPGTAEKSKERTSVFAKKDAQSDAAFDAIEARGAKVRVRTWENAVKQMEGWTNAQAVAALKAMPYLRRELYLLVEETHQGRVGVLRFFPKTSKQTRQKWADLAPADSKE